jgi:protein ImuB
MSLAEAAALVRPSQGRQSSAGLCVEEYDPEADRRALEALAADCQQFSPLVGCERAAAPESLFFDVTGLGPLLGGEEALAGRIVEWFGGRGLEIRLAIADTLGAAWALAHFGTAEVSDPRPPATNSLFHVPSLAPAHPGRHGPAPAPPPRPPAPDPLSPLPVEALRLPGPTVDLLHQLGLYQIGQLERLPREDLTSRFGPELLQRLDQAAGRLPETVPAMAPPPEFEVRRLLEYPSTRREVIGSLLDSAVGQLSQMLLRLDRGALRLECRLDCEGTKGAELSVGLFQPTASPRHLLELIRTPLERLSLPGAVTGVCLRAPLTAPLLQRQQELFVDASQLASHGRLLADLIDRLSSRLGEKAVVRPRLVADAQPELAWRYESLVGGRGPRRVGRKGDRPIFVAGYHAERGRHKNRDSPQGPAAELPPRPLRLLRRPIPLAVVSLAPDGPPLRFTWQAREHRVADVRGPERIETGWWRGRPIGRDYYRVATAAGACFWLFRRLRDGKWFLHGAFD